MGAALGGWPPHGQMARTARLTAEAVGSGLQVSRCLLAKVTRCVVYEDCFL